MASTETAPVLSLPRTSPSAAGVSAASVLAFIDAIESAGLELHSLMLLRHGQVVAEGWWSPYRREDPHLLYSLSKSFTSTAVGLAIDEGRLGLDDNVVSFFPDETPDNAGANLLAMRIRDLLTMTTGQDADDLSEIRTAKAGDWPRVFLARPVPYKPGTHFLYNSSATFMLSAILQRVTGQTLTEYLTPRLFEPLGIVDHVWEKSPQGVDVGGWGLSVSTESIAKFGQLYLQRGVWAGRRLVPAEWVGLATSNQVSNGADPENDWNQGYGFQFWRCRHNCYRGDGAFGQFCIVVPDSDMVVAMTSSTNDMGSVLRLTWEHLLPSVSAPVDAVADEVLTARLGDLRIPGPIGVSVSEVAAQTSGVHYTVGESELGISEMRFEFELDRAWFTACDARGEHRVEVGLTGWSCGIVDFDATMPPRKCAARGAWVAEDTFEFVIKDLGSPETTLISARFSGATARAEVSVKYRFGPCGPWVVEGKGA